MLRNLYTSMALILTDFLGPLYEPIFETHCQSLSHLEEVSQPLIVMVSGTPGMGKSTLMAQIETELKGVRVISDAIRPIMREAEMQPTKKRLAEYYQFFLTKLREISDNHLVLMDMSADRSYTQLKPVAEALGYPIFLIRLIATRESVEKRLLEREGPEKASNYYRFLDIWFQDYETFGEEATFDYIYDTENPQIEPLIDALRSRIAT